MEKYKKRILVTGGYGFIGSNFLNNWVPKCPDYMFVNLDNCVHGSDRSNVKVDNAENYVVHIGDISRKETLDWIFGMYDITDVIHFAAETHVDRSIENSAVFVKTNVLGTENLLKCFVEWDCHKDGGRFLHVSTDEVYGGWADVQWTEDTPLDPQNIYSATKASAEHLVVAYGNVHGIDYCITRAGNNYGENQDDSKLIPKMIKKALSGEPLEIYGDGTNFRQWTHVLDHVNGIMEVFNYCSVESSRKRQQKIFNIAGDDILTNNQVVEHILRETKSRSEVKYVPDRPGHDLGYSISCKKLIEHTFWKPSIPFSQGIASLIEKYTIEHTKNTPV